ncbi:unnamed protein product [Tetraodon nigroviridis]|uniref:(spotted green pufferfish) hypothetical protein n=1 Tax=Tetraodon nigroviridis TaxID=99883 RepID=Q4T1R0_TETNG|nr:unnamed protein product [Tetraodon nigroviridis]
MLEAFLSQPEKQSRHQVPELPRSSTESLILVANQDRCLDVEDVPPFPKSSAPPSSPAQTGGPAEPGDTRNVKTVSPHDHRAAPSSASLSSSVSDSKGSQHQTSVCGPDPAAVLQTCPMCCLLFPSGFSQMDQDRHLAKCLSEVRTDMTW